MIKLIKAKDPPRNYVARRSSKLLGEARDINRGTTDKEYDDDAVYELKQFIEDLKTRTESEHTRTLHLTMGLVVKGHFKYNF